MKRSTVVIRGAEDEDYDDNDAQELDYDNYANPAWSKNASRPNFFQNPNSDSPNFEAMPVKSAEHASSEGPLNAAPSPIEKNLGLAASNPNTSSNSNQQKQSNPTSNRPKNSPFKQLRQIALVDKFSMSFEGNVLNNSMALADVDCEGVCLISFNSSRSSLRLFFFFPLPDFTSLSFF